jgi:hypothetical protein
VALCVLAALSVRASAQTPPAPTQPAATPETPAADAPATNPQAAAPPAPSDTTVLPTIDVSAPRSPPQAQPNVAPRQAAPVPTPAPAPPSPYQTGAPNVAGGTPVVPQMASQMVISGANLNSRPVSESAEILEAAPGLAVVQHSGSGKANQYYLGGYNRQRHRHGDLLG